MPHNLFIPLGATVRVPVQYHWSIPVPAQNGAEMVPAGVTVSRGDSAAVTALVIEGGRAVQITGEAEGSALVELTVGGVLDALLVTVAVPVPNGVAFDVGNVVYDVSRIGAPPPPPPKPPERRIAQIDPHPNRRADDVESAKEEARKAEAEAERQQPQKPGPLGNRPGR